MSIAYFHSLRPEDTPGDGPTRTSAHLSIPVVASAVSANFKILHIDDSTDDHDLIAAACRRAGVPFDWQVAQSAKAGIFHLQQLVELSGKSPVGLPDLVLLDIVMPLMSGFEVLRYIRQTPELKHLPVVVYSGNPFPRNKEEALMLGANAFRLKPRDFQGAVAVVQDVYAILREIKGACGI